MQKDFPLAFLKFLFYFKEMQTLKQIVQELSTVGARTLALHQTGWPGNVSGFHLELWQEQVGHMRERCSNQLVQVTAGPVG